RFTSATSLRPTASLAKASRDAGMCGYAAPTEPTVSRARCAPVPRAMTVRRPDMPTKTRNAPSADRLQALYRTMSLIRHVEQTLSQLFANSEVPGFIHLSLGPEDVAA